MSEPNQEPTMEEILASIRRIISEDEAPAAEEAAPPPMPEIEEEPAGAPVMEAPAPYVEEAEAGDDILELTDRIGGPELAESHGDLDVYAAPEPEPAPPPRVAEEEPLVSRPTAESAASAFGALAQHVVMPREGRLLEDVVKELLRPLLKAWLDEHLPGIVQAKVEAEVERIARMRR